MKQVLSCSDSGPARLAGLLLGLVVMTTPLDAQSNPPDSLLDRLIGHWVLQGPMAGQRVTHDVTCEWVLGHEYVRLHEVSRERSTSGGPAYEAIVYLVRDPRTKEYAALWLDNTGYGPFEPSGVGHATVSADSLPFVVVDSDTSRFHNPFVYKRTTDTWEWHMANDEKGVLRPFAWVTLTKQR